LDREGKKRGEKELEKGTMGIVEWGNTRNPVERKGLYTLESGGPGKGKKRGDPRRIRGRSSLAGLTRRKRARPSQR